MPCCCVVENLKKKMFFCLCSGYANRKGQGCLQRLRRLHCPGGRLLAREALCGKRRGQQVSRHTEERRKRRRRGGGEGVNGDWAKVSISVLSAWLSQSYHYPGGGGHPRVSRVHAGV